VELEGGEGLMPERNFRETILEVIHGLSQGKTPHLQINDVLFPAAKRLEISQDEGEEQTLLTSFYDLFRVGYLAWGRSLSNAEPPFFHLTDLGRNALQNYSRDPSNPQGYLSFLRNAANLNPVALSYIEEGLMTFNQNCIRATAVMVGGAAESLVLELRDTLVSRLGALNEPIPQGLNDWKIKKVLDSLAGCFRQRKLNMPDKLFGRFDSHWSAFTYQIRASRNDSGHPARIDPVTEETVHASLLIFPALATLVNDLKEWVSNIT